MTTFISLQEITASIRVLLLAQVTQEATRVVLKTDNGGTDQQNLGLEESILLMVLSIQTTLNSIFS
jgi:hypothetical protein